MSHHDDPLNVLKAVIARAERGDRLSNILTSVRHIHEKDEDTLKRVIEAARKVTCPGCGGRGTGVIVDRCRACGGSGERAYDPNLPVAQEVMEA